MKYNQTKSKLAFSLIELSVVILVIGILVIGITQGSRILTEANLKSARSLTASSPVTSIGNIGVWLETTSEKSLIDSEKINTALAATGTVSTWNDINPQTSSPNNATQGTIASKPRYITNTINGLPALNFDGVNDYLQMTNILATNFTVFVLLQTNNAGFGLAGDQAYSNSGILWADIGGLANDSIPLAIGGGVVKTFVGGGFEITANGSTAVNNNRPNVVTITRSMSSGVLSLYVNGVSNGSVTGSSNVVLTANPVLSIGGNIGDVRYYTGNLGEIIAFNKLLTNTERVSVEQYLATKWGN